MSKGIVAIDIDEVLFPMVEAFLNFHNAIYGTALRSRDLKSYHVAEITGETQEQMDAKLEAFVRTPEYRMIPPLKGAIEGVQKLQEKYPLILITARSQFHRGVTEEFLETHFKDIFGALHYTHLVETPNIRRPKYILCQELGATTLVDDSLRNISDCAANGVQGVLFGDYPWNQTEELPTGVTRCKDWEAVVEYFDGRDG